MVAVGIAEVPASGSPLPVRAKAQGRRGGGRRPVGRQGWAHMALGWRAGREHTQGPNPCRGKQNWGGATPTECGTEKHREVLGITHGKKMGYIRRS